MTSSSTALSFLVAAYNMEAFLDDCIASVVAAAGRDDEIVIVDDGSTDATAQIAQSWHLRHPSLVRVVRQANAGVSAARNQGVHQATRPYLMFLDADDVVVPDTFGVLRDVLTREQPDITVCDYWRWRPERGEHLRSPACSHPRQQRSTDREAWCQQTFTDSLWSASSRVFRRSLLEQIGPDAFPVGDRYEDTATIPRLTLRATSFYYLPQPLFKYRLRADSFIHTKKARHCLDYSKALARCNQEVASADMLPKTILMSNMASVRNGLTAMREAGYVEDRTSQLYRELIETLLGSLSLPVDEVIDGLKRSDWEGGPKLARHLWALARWPRLYTAQRQALYAWKRWLAQRRMAQTSSPRE